MATSDATTADQYLAELPEDRREALSQVRDVILANLPDGFVESMSWGMITYEVPLQTFGDTYNGKPLMYAALASQKQHMAIYLTSVDADPGALDRFRAEYLATGKELDMGRSCVRFKQLDHLPLDVIGRVIGATSVAQFLDTYRASRDR